MTAPSAWAGWSAPANVPILDPFAPVALSADVAVGPDGVGTAVWIERDDGPQYEVRAARISPSGGASPLPDLLTGAASAPTRLQVVTGTDGTATVVWRRTDGEGAIQMARIGPSGTPSAPADLSSDGAATAAPHLSVGPDGTSAIVWAEADGGGDPAVRMARIDPEGNLDDLGEISADGEDASSPRVAIGAGGAAAVLWHADAIGLRSLRVDSEGAAGEIHDVAEDTDGGTYPPSVAIGPDGAATAVWQRADADGDVTIETVRLDPGGVPGTVRPVGSPHYVAAASLGHHPKVVVGPSGTATLIWSESTIDTPYVVRTARVGPSGVPGEPLTLSPAGVRSALDADVAIEPDGEVSAIWYGYHPDDGDSTIEVRRIGPSGNVGAVESLALTEDPLDGIPDLSSPAVAADTGGVTAVWLSSTAMSTSRFTESGPTTPPPVTPPHVTPPPVTPPPLISVPPPVTPPTTKQPGAPPRTFSFVARKRKLAVRRGRTARFSVAVRNAGGSPAKKVRICAKASKRVLEALRMSRCVRVGSLPAKRLSRRGFAVKPKPAARRGATYRFKLIVRGAGLRPKSISVRVAVR